MNLQEYEERKKLNAILEREVVEIILNLADGDRKKEEYLYSRLAKFAEYKLEIRKIFEGLF